MEKILVKRKEFHFYDQWICHRGKTSEGGQNADFEKFDLTQGNQRKADIQMSIDSGIVFLVLSDHALQKCHHFKIRE